MKKTGLIIGGILLLGAIAAIIIFSMNKDKNALAAKTKTTTTTTQETEHKGLGGTIGNLFTLF